MISIPKFKYDDVEINYIKKGKGEPLVLVMGLGRKLSGWQLQVPFFQRKIVLLQTRNIWMNHSGYLKVDKAELRDKLEDR